MTKDSQNFVIEAIEKVIRRKGCIRYLCKWLNSEERTEEPWENIGRFQAIYTKTKGTIKKAAKRKRSPSTKQTRKRRKHAIPHIPPRIGPEYQAVIPPYEGPAFAYTIENKPRLMHMYL